MAFIRRILASALLVTMHLAASANAQSVGVVQSNILVLDPERLFEETLLGQRMLSELQTEREGLIARNRRLEAELEAEERALTDLRPDTSPEEFRQLADKFDAKVQEIRQDSERRVRDLERNRERAPLDFLRQVEPIVVNVMREAGGAVVMDARSVLLHADVIDITDLTIERIDETIGDGTQLTDDPSSPGSDNDEDEPAPVNPEAQTGTMPSEESAN